MIRDSYASEGAISKSLTEDSLRRNYYLANLIRIFNSTKKHTVYTLDGDWGSGKTFFVKQLEFASAHPQNYPNLFKELINTFNANYSVFYFNAWEHDNQPALESVLLSLREVAWDDQDELAGHVVEIAKLLIDLPIRIISDGNVKLDELKRSYLDSYIEAADKASKTSKEIRNMIDNYKERTKKKILFIIDDLDRCRPSYAVELLESIKHCFNCDNAVFLICANNEQLQYTVKKYYGEGFDGYAYLDRFYDSIFNLPEPNIETYIKHHLKIENPDYYYNLVAIDLAKVFNMSLRQINRYMSDLSLVSDILEDSGFDFEQNYARAVKGAFIPIASVLKIMEPEKFRPFINGKGADIIRELFSKSQELSILDKSLGGNTGNGSALIIHYNNLFRDDIPNAQRSADLFKKATTSMGFSVVIDEE